MAYSSKYQKYLNKKERERKSPIKKMLVTGTKIVGAAALIGGGYHGLEYLKKSGAFDDLAKKTKDFLHKDSTITTLNKIRNKLDKFEAVTSGIDKTIKTTGYRKILSGKAEKQLASNITEELKRVRIGRARGIGGTPTEFEKQLLRYTQTVKEIASRTVENVRFKNVLRDYSIRYKKDEKAMEFVKEVLSKEIGGKNSKKLFKLKNNDEKSKKFVNELLSKYNAKQKLNESQYIDVQQSFFDILRKHKVTKEYVKKHKDVIRSQTDAIRKQYEKSIVDSIKSKTKASKGIERITGYKQVTVGEAVKKGILQVPSGLKKKYYEKTTSSGEKILEVLNLDPQNIAQTLLDRDIPGLSDAFIDPGVFMSKQGKIIDLRTPGRISKKTFNGIAEGIQIPFIGIKPLKMIKDVFGLGIKDMPKSNVFLRGSVMPTINNSKKMLAQDFFYFNGKLVDHKGNLIAEGHLRQSTRGISQRAVRTMSGFTSNPKANVKPTTIGGYVKKYIFDIGYQDYESDLKHQASFFTKFKNDEWIRNIWANMTRKGSSAAVSEDNIQDAFKKIYKIVGDNTKALDKNTLDLISPHLKGILSDETLENLTYGSRKDSVVSAIYELLQKDAKEKGSKSVLIYQKQLQGIFAQFNKDPDSFDKAIKTLSEGVNISYVSGSKRALTKLDEAEKILHAELLHQVELETTYSVGDLAKELILKGASNKQVNTLKNLNVYQRLQRMAGSNYYAGTSLDENGLKTISAFFQQEAKDGIKDQLQDIIYKTNPKWGLGPKQEYKAVFEGNQYLFVRNSKKANLDDIIISINDSLKQGNGLWESIKAGKDTLADLTYHQWGFGKASKRAGRNNLDKVTRTSIGWYHSFFRINELFNKVGLGLSTKNMGSTQDIALNLLTKRIMAPLGAYYGLKYINDELGNLSGQKPTQVLGTMYANVTIGMQAIKEVTGINAVLTDLKRTMPGVEKLGENPIGLGLKYGTFGFIGETRSPSEMKEYYDHGKDPIRRGRFWEIGSSTPIYGDRIKYWQDNWYNRLQADPMMTDVMYGSTGEYWANHWLPNPRNPLGFLKPFRRRHWIKKHWEDRPYPITTSGLEGIPIVGPILDSTVGRILVPFRKRRGLERAHQEYLTEINELTRHYTSKVNQPGYVYMSGGGRISSVQLDVDSIENDRMYSITEGSSGIKIQGGPVATQDGTVRIVDATNGFSPMQSGSYISKSQLTGINKQIIDQQYIKPIDTRSIKSLRDNLVVENLEEAVNPSSLSYRLGETYYSATEFLGIYGFGLSSITGDLGDKKPVLQSSSRMMGLSRKFWDQELGGLGGNLSEAYRRFLPHRRRQIKEYNPIKNTMPDWMPGPEYFVDYKHGDPYCVSKDTLIEIGELDFNNANSVNTNDIITTHSGNNVPVKRAVPRQIKKEEKVYKIKVASLSGTVQEFSEEHPILVLNTTRQSVYYENKVRNLKPVHLWKKAKDIKVGDYTVYPRPKFSKKDIIIDMHEAMLDRVFTKDYIYITAHCSRDFAVAYEWLEKHPDIKFKRGERKQLLKELNIKSKPFEAAQYSIKKNIKPNRVKRFIKVDEDIAYLFGIYLAKGSLGNGYVNLAHNIKEKEYSNRAIIGARKIDSDCTCTFAPIQGTKGAFTTISSTAVNNLLEYLFNKGLANKCIPNIFAHADEEITKSLLKGMFDGDGSLYVDNTSSQYSKIGKYRINLKLNNKKLLLQVRKLVLQYGFVFNCNKDYIVLRGSSAVKFADFLGYHVSEYILEQAEKTRNATWTIITNDYVYCRVINVEEVDYVKTVYGFEVNVDDSFCIAGIATHNTKIPKGELRLPGAGYESLNDLHPDFFGEYGALDRFKILADVAPYSEQYKYYNTVVSRMHKRGMIADEDYDQVKEIRDMVIKQKEKYDLHPYKFVGSNVHKEKVTVLRWVDKDTFLTKEHPGTPIRLAGIKMPSKADESEIANQVRELLHKHVTVGKKVRIGLNADALMRTNNDTLGTMDAVIYTASGAPLNSKLARISPFFGGENPVKADWDSTESTDVNALYDKDQITLGKVWERFAHLDTPIHTKFLQIRSPLEMYKRKELYGKSWQTWQHPLRDWVKPTFESYWKHNPIIAGGLGAGFGWLLGVAGISRRYTVPLGFLAGALGSSIRTVGDFAKRITLLDRDATWIPKRRRKQREINEYFDKLKYVKYKGLYEKARRVAIKEEGIDPEDIVQESLRRSKSKSFLTKKTKDLKRHLKTIFSGEPLNKMRYQMAKEELDQVVNYKTLSSVGPITLRALQYREQYLSTLYGADPYGDLKHIYRALPKKDKEFFKYFMTAKPKEREEILRLVPEDQKRFYQAKWGLKPDKKQSIAAYFAGHKLPGANWAGWDPNHSIDEMKLKFLKNEGMEVQEFGYWEDDVRYIANTPTVKKIKGGNPIINEQRLIKVLNGAGIEDVDITIQLEKYDEEPSSPFNFMININQDRRCDFNNVLNNNISSLVIG